MTDPLYLGIGDGGPEAVIDLMRQVMGVGDDFDGQSLVDAIRQIEAGNPWGVNDQFAKEFKKNYHVRSGGSAVPVNEAVHRSVTDAGPAASNIGSTGIEAMTKFQALDEDAASGIKAIRGGMDGTTVDSTWTARRA